MKMLFVVLVMAFTSVVSAANFQVEKVQTLGELKHRIIFQSNKVKFNKKSKELSTLVVARWGTEVFELAQANFKCSSDLKCEYTSYKHLTMFRSCVVEGEAVYCERPISRSYEPRDYDDVIVSENPDEVRGDYDHSRNGGYYDPEFPVRDNEEYPGMF